MLKCKECGIGFMANFSIDKCWDCRNLILSQDVDNNSISSPDLLAEELKTPKGFRANSEEKSAKNRLDLVPPELMVAAGRALTSGLKKYPENDWKNKPDCGFEAALLRHLMDHLSGKVVDQESGLSALDHVAANLAILIYKQDEKFASEVKKMSKCL